MQEGEEFWSDGERAHVHIIWFWYTSLTLFSPSPLSLVSAFQEFACNGTVVEHPEYGEVIQLQGDQRNNIVEFLKKVQIAKPEQLKVHGF